MWIFDLMKKDKCQQIISPLKPRNIIVPNKVGENGCMKLVQFRNV